MKHSILFLGMIFFLFWQGCASLTESNTHWPENTDLVCVESNCFAVELASNSFERETGLMFRTELLPENGMLFTFEDEKKHGFWMKNTLLPLDVIWINSNYEIVDIQSLQPCKTNNCPTFYPKDNALYVLEVNAGEALEKGFVIGETVAFDLEMI